jgi:hypothetical protein
MAEEIVACPGCAKKFRIPEGAPPGSFPCTACGVDVPYGAKAPAPAARQAARPAAKAAASAAASRPAQPARQQAAPARPAAAAPRRAAAAEPAERPSRGRRQRDDDYAPPEKKGMHPGALWGGIGGVVVVIGILAYAFRTPAVEHPTFVPPTGSTSPTPPAAAPKAATPAPEPAPAPVSATPPAAAPAPEPAAVAPKPADAPKPAAVAPKPADPPKPSEPARPAGASAMLGQPVADVAGVTAAERSDMDRMVALAMDLGSGKDGSTAEANLVRLSKKAIPALLSAFSKQYSGSKWGTEAEQIGAEKIQDVLHRIAQADGPNSKVDFTAHFLPGALSPPEDFEKAARMWMDWWNAKGSNLDKYRRNGD